jgi:hypothetical protein
MKNIGVLVELMVKVKSKKQLPKKTEIKDSEELLPILQDLVNAAALIMKVPSVKILEAELKNGLFYFKLTNKTFSCSPSALYTLLSKIFEDIDGFSSELLYTLDHTASLYRAFRFHSESLIILRLIQYLANHDNEQEARLCAIQSQVLEDFRKGEVQIGEDFQEDVQVGIDLFSKLKLKSEKLLVASSETAMVLKLLPMIKNPEINEALFAAVWVLNFIPMALFHSSGKKKDDICSQIKEAQVILEKHPHQLLRDYAQLFSRVLISF